MAKQTTVSAFNCPNCGAAIAPDSPSCCYCGSSIAARVCPSCFGAVYIGMKHCPHCGAEAAGPASGKRSTLLCPRCEADLAVIPVDRISMHACRKCGGLWVEKTFFQRICTKEEEQETVLGFQFEVSGEPAVRDDKPKRIYIPCPECGKLMNHKNFSGSGIVLDWCRDHGSWFDRNELQQIVRFIGSGGLRKAREREKLRLHEQENRLRMQEFSMASLERRLEPNPGRRLDHGMDGDSLIDFLSRMFQ